MMSKSKANQRFYREYPLLQSEEMYVLEWRDRNNQPERPTLCLVRFQLPYARHCFLSSVQPATFPAKVIKCSEWQNRLRNKPHIGYAHRLRQSINHVKMPQLSVHRVHLQQDTNKEVKVLHRRHHMCLWKSRKTRHTCYSTPNLHTPAYCNTSFVQ